MPASMRVTLDMRRLQELSRNFNGNADKAVGALAHQAVGEVQNAMTVQDIIDTGTGRASIHVEETGQTAQRRVADGTDYLIYHEFGTIKMAARPFFMVGILRAVKGLGAAVKAWVFR